MRDPNRIPVVLAALEAAWKRSPYMRLGQLIINLSDNNDRPGDIFNREDDKWLQRLEQWMVERA